MPVSTSRFQVILSVNKLKDGSDQEFAAAASEFLDRLEKINDLDVEVPKRPQPGTRGLIAVLTSIIVLGTKVGAFKAIYTLATDFLSRYQNAEVELKFNDGSTLKLKGLSQANAERLIEEHLRKASETPKA